MVLYQPVSFWLRGMGAIGTGKLPVLAICAGAPSFKKYNKPGKGSFATLVISFVIFITGSQLICGKAYSCTSLLLACTSIPIILIGLLVVSSSTACVLSKTKRSFEKPSVTPIKSALVLTSSNVKAFRKGVIFPCERPSCICIIACISLFSIAVDASLSSFAERQLLFCFARVDVRLFRTEAFMISWFCISLILITD